MKTLLVTAIAVLLICSGCEKDDPPASSSGENDTGDSQVVGPDARGPQGGDYLATVIRSRNHAQKAVSGASLRQVGAAVLMYQSENSDTAPADLQILVSDDYLMESNLISPADRKTPIVYVRPAREADPQTIVAYDPALYPGDELNVLLLDGSVQQMSQKDLEAKLKAQGYTPDAIIAHPGSARRENLGRIACSSVRNSSQARRSSWRTSARPRATPSRR